MQHMARPRKISRTNQSQSKSCIPTAQAKNCAIKNYPKQLNITASYVTAPAIPPHKPKLLHKAIMLSSRSPSHTSRTRTPRLVRCRKIISSVAWAEIQNTRSHFLSGGMKGMVCWIKSAVALQRVFEACMPRMPTRDQSTQPSKTRYPFSSSSEFLSNWKCIVFFSMFN